MADRTSAGLFADIFDLIDKYVPEAEREKVAKHYWSEARGYDFSNYQLGCDDVLVRLGLAKKGVDPDYPEDGEVIFYKGGRGFR